MQANSPFTGFMNMFFQTSAETVRHHEEGRDHQDAHDALAPDRLVQQQRQQDAADHRDQKHAATSSSVLRSAEEGRIGEEILVVLEPRAIPPSPGISRL
jgi:hypothetical protein